MKKILFLLFAVVLAVFVVSCDQEAHQHSWDAGEITIPATCVSIGTKTYRCTVCGEEKTEVIEKTDHIPGTPKTSAATCTEEGCRETACAVCGKILDREMIPALGHVWDSGEVVNKPSCMSIGSKVYTCLTCGETHTVILEKTEHEAGVQHTQEPTCTSAGYTETVCSVCGEVFGHEVLPATGHLWDEGEISVAPTCVSIGAAVHTCSVCGEKKTVVLEMTEHTPGDEKVVGSTCSVNGYRETTCQVCGHVYNHEVLPLAPHAWDEGDVVVPPTCTAIGTRTHTCTACGETKVSVIPATGHTAGDPVVVDPTCASKGYTEVLCTVCGARLEYEETEMTEHDPADPVTVPPSCDTPGYTETVCTQCGEILSHEDIPALGHLWEKTSTVTAPTCEEAGDDLYTCTRCGQTKHVVTEALGHDFGEPIEIIDPTCVTKGSEYHRCSRCDLAQWTEIDMVDHTWNAGVITTPSTCTEEGVRTHTCSVCGATKTTAVDKIAHEYVFDRVSVAATCVSTGTDIYVCSSCGKEESRSSSVNASNHVNTEWQTVTDPLFFVQGLERLVCTDCQTPTGDTRPVDRLSETGHWVSGIENTMMDEIPLSIWYELDFSDGHMVLSAFYDCPDIYDYVIFETFLDTDYILVYGEDNPAGPGSVCSLADPDSLHGLSYDVFLGVSASSASGFTLFLDDFNGDPSSFVFTRTSLTAHSHSFSGEYIDLDDVHGRLTSCAGHSVFMNLEEHESTDGIVCDYCGALIYYDIYLSDGGNSESVQASVTEGYLLSAPTSGEAWYSPEEEIYYMAGETFHPVPGNNNRLFAVTF